METARVPARPQRPYPAPSRASPHRSRHPAPAARLEGGSMTVRILQGDCRAVLRTLPDQSVHCCVTSPPYFGLRDYGMAEQIGLEATPEDFVAQWFEVFREVRRVLRDDGTLWVNLGDSYAGSGRGGNPTEATSTHRVP